ncbi:MAG: hypothetical protein JOZ15_19330, partial [Acidobacteria bacterium]|nr:hypothetical protein [Acidobacteriota bacterium]
AGLLALAPALLTDAVTGAGGAGGLLHNALLSPMLLALWFGGLPAAVLVTHFGAVIMRTRSPWLILDLAGAVAAGALALATFGRLEYWGALDPGPWSSGNAQAVGAAFAGVVLLALLLASAAQVLVGRTDAVRGHRSLSLAFAGINLAGALAFAALAQHWIAIGPLDLERWSFAAVSRGGAWIALSGPAPGPPHYGASFLLHAASGRSIRTRFALGPYSVLPIAFSADGRRAVWVEREGGEGSPAAVLRLDLDRPAAEPVARRSSRARRPAGSPSRRTAAASRRSPPSGSRSMTSTAACSWRHRPSTASRPRRPSSATIASAS